MAQWRTYVGIDPSLTCTGLARLTITEEGNLLWATDRIKSKAPNKSVAAQFEHRRTRQRAIARQLRDFLEPVVALADICIEQPAYASVTGSVHDRAGLWWAIYDVAADQLCTGSPFAGRPLIATPQARMTIATGRGNAGKEEVMAAMIRRFLDVEIPDNNVADAVGLALLAAGAAGEDLNKFFGLSKTHLRALDKLTR